MDEDSIRKAQMKQGIAGVFSRASSTYDQVGPRFFSYFGRRLVEVAQIPAGSRVLDIATGRGAVLFPAAERVGPQGYVIGIDLAEDMVKQTADEIKRRGSMPIEHAAKACGGVSFRLAMDLFEEASKMRAARLMWRDLLGRRYGITDEKVLGMRIHCVTAGSAMTYQQPLNNIVRGTMMGLAGILGGIQSLGISGYDEALSVPSAHAHQISLRIQQILLHETNAGAVTDPLGGSYYVEALTANLVEKAWEFFEQIQQEGGFLAALDSGWLHQRAHENQQADLLAQASGERVIVGVTDFRNDASPYLVDGFRGVSNAFDDAMERLQDIRRTRSSSGASRALRELEAACRGSQNIMPAMLDALDAEVTLGEIGDVYRDVFGDWTAPAITV